MQQLRIEFCRAYKCGEQPSQTLSFVFFVTDCIVLLLLDQAGIAASSGSACTSGSLDPSHVLLAIGVPVEVAHGSLRLSLSGENTPAQVAHIAETVPRVVAYLRSISPVWEQMQNEKA